MPKISNTTIPKYIKKRIKNFDKLTKNQQLYEAELFRLVRRAGKEFAHIFKEAYKRPEHVTQKDIKNIQNIRGEKLKQEKQEHFEDNFFVDEDTGEVIDKKDVAPKVEFAKDLIDEIYSYIDNQESEAIVGLSSYRSGRTKSARSREWLSNNIKRSTRLLKDRLDSIRSSDESLKAFTEKFSDDKLLADLKDAISEYIVGSYKVADNLSYFQSSKVYYLLSDMPVSLGETMEFEYEE